jgi:GntR family transcriptional repressor for pyruvate dehydrogenase complex
LYLKDKFKKFMNFDAIQIHSAPETLVEKILEQINAGELTPGDCLPSQRELARMFGVGLGTVREALKILHVMGCVEILRGKGSYVTDKALGIQNGSPSFEDALEAVSLAELMKAREVVECGAARMAAKRADPENIRQLRKITAQMSADGLYNQAYYENDFRFHIAVAEASDNQAVLEIVKLLVDKTLHHINFMNTALGIDLPASMGQCVGSAIQVVDLIEKGDAEGADKAMFAHLNTVNVSLLKEFPLPRPKAAVQQHDREGNANGTGTHRLLGNRP